MHACHAIRYSTVTLHYLCYAPCMHTHAPIYMITSDVRLNIAYRIAMLWCINWPSPVIIVRMSLNSIHLHWHIHLQVDMGCMKWTCTIVCDDVCSAVSCIMIRHASLWCTGICLAFISLHTNISGDVHNVTCCVAVCQFTTWACTTINTSIAHHARALWSSAWDSCSRESEKVGRGLLEVGALPLRVES